MAQAAARAMVSLCVIPAYRGYVAVLLGGVDHFLGGELLECADYAETGVARLDNVVDVAVFGCIVGVAEQFVVFGFAVGEHFGGIVRMPWLPWRRAPLRRRTAHNGDFSGRPCVVHIAAKLLAAHHDMAAAVALAQVTVTLGTVASP